MSRRFRPTLAPRKETDEELYLGNEVVAEVELPRRHPTTLLSGQALAERKGWMVEGLVEEEVPSSRETFPLCELPALEIVSPVHELPALELVSPLHEALSQSPIHSEISVPSSLQPDLIPLVRDEELAEMPGGFPYQAEVEGDRMSVELPGDFTYPSELQKATAEAATADELLHEWNSLVGDFDLGSPFREKFREELLMEEESRRGEGKNGETSKRVGSGKWKCVKVWVSVEEEGEGR